LPAFAGAFLIGRIAPRRIRVKSVHRFLYTSRHDVKKRRGRVIYHIGQSAFLFRREIAQHVIFHASDGRTTDSDADPYKIRSAAPFNNRLHSLMPRGTTADLNTRNAEAEVQLVVNDDHILHRYLKKVHGLLNRVTAEIHKGHGFEQYYVLTVNPDFRELAAEFSVQNSRSVLFGEAIQYHETRVVTIGFILRLRVSESSD
jgi:hypothetical protein